MLKNQMGYLRIRSFGNFGASPLFSDQIAALETALDSIFSDAAGMKGLVIDVRINGGGSDNFGALIASRLTAKRYLAYSKTYRNDPRDPRSLGAPQPIWIEPSTRPGFTGPVALLIGHDSVSAAETFPMALQGRLPAIPFIGENTQGVFSDVLIRKTPNGIGFGLPNEIYLTKDGKAYDVVGVPPTVRIPVFTPQDLAAHRDPALEKAIDMVSAG
jgi:C-terminal processing protease CtpA/Prc